MSYGVNKIRAAIPANTPTNMPMMPRPTSMITSWVDGGLDYAERRVVHRRCHRMVSLERRGRSSVAQGVTGLKHEREGCTIRQVEEFRASDQSGDCCQIPQRREGYRFSREEPEGSNTDGRGRLRSHGFPLEVGIENDAPTFNTAHLAGLVFLLRDAIGDQTSMCTGAGWAHRERLRGSS